MASNPYDDLIAAPGTATAGPSTNPYDSILVDEQARQQTQLRATVSLAADTSPQAIAAQRQLAKYVGFTPAVGEALPAEIKQMATVKRVADDTAKQPVLRKAYTDADFARIGHDDSGPLKSVGTAMEFLGKSTWSGFLSLDAAAIKLFDAFFPGTFSEGEAAQLYKNDPEGFKKWQESAGGSLTRWARNLQADSEWMMDSLSDDAKRAYGELKYNTLTEDKSAWRSPVKVVGDAVQSLPTSVALGLTAYLTRGASLEAAAAAEAAGLSAAAVRAAAIEAGARSAAKVGAISEGAAGYAQQSLQTASDGEKVKQSDLEQSEAYQRLIKEGFHPTTARALVIANAAEQSGQIAGIADAAVNYVGGRFLGRIIGEGGNWYKAGAKGLANEAVTEGIQSPIEQFGQNWALKQNVNPNQDLGEGVVESMLQGIAVGGLTGGAFSAASARGAKRHAQMEEAQAHADRLTDLFKAATLSQVRERDPEAFSDLVQQMADATPGAPSTVYIDAQKLVETLQANPEAAGVFNQMPAAVQEQVQEALLRNGAVEIPIGELVAKGAGTALEGALLPHIRRTENSLSQAEAKESSDNAKNLLLQEAESFIAKSERGEAIRTSADVVGQKVLDQLNAIGRNTADVNKTYAALIRAFYTATSARLGMTPEEMFAKHPLSIKGETVGEAFNAKPATQGQITEAGTTRTDGTDATISGAGLTLVHGSTSANLTLDNIEIVREGQKQAKKGRKLGGFYLSSTDNLDHAQGYASMAEGTPTVYDVRVKEGTKVLQKQGDVTRLSENYIKELLDQGYGLVVGRDPRGRTEYVVIDKGAIESMAKRQAKTGELTVEGFHYSNEARPLVDTAKFGTGLQGSNRDQYLNATDERLSKRAYFYADKGTGINPEDGVGGVAQKATLTNVYDADADPLRLKKGDQLAFESAVLDAGFSGYLTRMDGSQSGQVIMLGDQKIKTQAIGPATKLQGQVVPAPQAREIKGRDAIVEALNAAKGLPSGSPTRARWSEILQAQLPEVHAALEAAGVFSGNINENLYKSELIRDFESRTQAPVYNQTPGALPEWSLEKVKTRITDAIKKAAIALSPTAKQARKNYEKLDAVFAKVPDPLASEEAWRKFMSLLVADRDVLGVPYNALKYAQNPQAVADYLSRLRPDQLASRRAGFELGAKIRREYIEGRATPVITGRLLLWAMLSRKAGAYPHEAAYMDLVNGGVDQWIEKAVNGTWTEADSEGYVKWSSEFMASKKGGVSPSAGVTSNANDFGRILLTKMSAKDESGQTSLTRLHNLIADQNVSTDQVRREFFALGDSLGIQNKVLSFALLVTGRWDTLVLDRVQFTHLWGDRYRERAGQRNIYDNGLATAGEGHFGLAVYEALARGMTDSVSRGYALAGLTEQGDGTLGAFHWDSWLIESSQAIGHPTIEALDTASPRPDLAVRQGKFDTYGYNFEYRADGQYQIPLLDGSGYIILAPAEASAFQGRISDPKEGVVPKDFKVSQNKASPWVDAEGVNRGRYDEILNEYGRRADAADVAPAGLADAGGPIQQRATDAGRAGQTAGAFNQTGGVNGRPEQTGDRGGRYSSGGLAPLEGAPTVAGATGPDPRIVAVAEQYARDNGIDLKRQSEYVKVDPERAARIAAAYEAMEHAPNDPAVKAQYAALLQETTAQYRALKAAGYQFYLVDETNDPYAGNPWNAMRDLRANQTMGVFATEAGFGSGATELNVDDNPLLADTGLEWGYGSPDGPKKRVLANDLFRAVHDAFGHGMEGAGFRAQGEENAWQAHHGLFSPAAIGALTSETRGQNSWLNYGPHGATNQTAKVEDTVFADQKTGLMPEWTWTEGLAGDMPADTLKQNQPGPRGTFNPKTLTISLLQSADLSTFLHESGHFFLEVMADLASQENAPAEIREDFAKILKWFGVKDAEDGTKAIDVWRGMSLDEQRPHHERWAESFEHYLMEGKAPSLELRGPFQRFRSWLTTVYKSLKDFAKGRDLQISGEIRRVMDRLVATEEQIAEAEQQAKYEAIYKSAEEAGMDEYEWAVYQEMHRAGTDAAIDAMQARSMADLKWAAEARSKALRKAQRAVEELRKAMREKVTEEVMASPLELARAYIKEVRQSTPEQKEALKAWNEQRAAALAAALDAEKAALLAANPEVKGIQKGQLLAKNQRQMANAAEAKALAWEQQNPRPARVLPAIEMDSIAELFGFSSGDELTKAMKEQPSAKEMIDGLTEQRLLEEHGELVTQKGIQQAAAEAVHNEARARFVATELATMRAAMGQKEKTPGSKVSTNVLIKSAKEFAAAIIGRRKIMDLNPTRYTSAETRAAAAVQKAMAAGDQAGAIAAQRDRLLNLYAAKEAFRVRDEMKKAVEYLRKFEKESVRKALDSGYLDQIDALLEKFDLKAGTTQKEIARRKSLDAWIKSQQAVGIDPNIPQELIDKAGLTSYKEMSVEDFRGLTDTIKQIEHLGRLKNKLLTAKEQREYEAVRDAIATSITDLAGDRKADTRTPTTNMGRWFQAVKNFGAAHIKAATWARILDGGKDAGLVWEYFVRPANERANMETTMRAKSAEALHAIIEPWLKGTPAGGNGVFFPGINRSLNRESILAIALNTGNESNLQRLLGGEGWTLQQLKPVLDTLSQTDWKVVQQIWDHFESYRPLIGAKEMRVYGKEPAWIAHGSPVTNLYGVPGGYYPIKYDPAASVRAEEHADAEGAKRQLQGAYGAATTRRSFTKGRVEEVNGRPLLYTLSGLYSGVNDVIHDLAWHEWLIDVNRLLKSQKIDGAIREHYGPAAVRQLKTWRDAIAEGDSGSQEAIDSALGRLRQGVSVAGLGFNVMSALMQPLGMTQSISRVGAKWIGKGMLQYIANPAQATRDVHAQSEFMAGRARTQFRDLNEVRNRVQGQTPGKEKITRYAYFLMMQCQQMVDVPTWLGAYEKAMSEGNDDERSKSLADQAVIDAQGGGETKDLSAIERGGPAQKLFTVFYSFMNTALNLGVQKTMNREATPAGRAKLAADMLMLYSVPAVLGSLLKDALTPGDSGDYDDWEKILRKLLGSQLDFLLGLMVVTREFGEAGKALFGLEDHPRDYSGPAGVRLVADTGTAAKQIHQGEFDDALRKAMVNLAGDVMGLPSAQINRSITGANAMAEGKTMNPFALLLGYQEAR